MTVKWDANSLTSDLVGYFEAMGDRGMRTTPYVATEIAISGTYGSDGRLDAVVLSWGSNWQSVMMDGYEIKVTRSDLFRDIDAAKYRRYFKSGIHRLYFAIPSGLAKKEEIPEDCGVMCRGPKGWSVVRRAPNHRQGEMFPPVAAVLRMLRAEAHISYEWRRRFQAEDRRNRIAAMAQYTDRELARMIRGNIADLASRLETREHQVTIREQNLKVQEERLQALRETLEHAPHTLKAIGDLLHMAGRAISTNGYNREHAAMAIQQLVGDAQKLEKELVDQAKLDTESSH